MHQRSEDTLPWSPPPTYLYHVILSKEATDNYCLCNSVQSKDMRSTNLLFGWSFGFVSVKSFSLNVRDSCKKMSPKILGSSLRPKTSIHASRREIMIGFGGLSSLILSPITYSVAEEGDMTSKMFNEDGSLKDGEVKEAKQRSVEFKWDGTENGRLSEDGLNKEGTSPGSQVTVAYEFPEKWSDGRNGDEIYYDRSEGTNAKACKRITVFQAPGKADMKQLQKATTIGVAKTLNVPESLSRLYKADIISGRVSKKNGQTYYQFDMASAPESCGKSDENLGLGFCPYDNIFLLSATIVNDRLYCMAVECDSTRIWKIASADLKRVRSSFTVEDASTE